MNANDLPADFSARIDSTTGCWLWTGGIDSYGYGRIYGYGAPILAHRCVYEILVGPIPDRLTLDHLCRIKRCVNPDHLEPVSLAVNIRRAAAARRAAKEAA